MGLKELVRSEFEFISEHWNTYVGRNALRDLVGDRVFDRRFGIQFILFEALSVLSDSRKKRLAQDYLSWETLVLRDQCDLSFGDFRRRQKDERREERRRLEAKDSYHRGQEPLDYL